MLVCLDSGGAGNPCEEKACTKFFIGLQSKKIFCCGLDRRLGFCANLYVSAVEEEHSRRKADLLLRLETRSVSCPGLYPVKTREDFLRLALDHGAGSDESICRILEALWRRPDEAVQMNAQSLIQRGQGLDRGAMRAEKAQQDRRRR